jgi:hypothetical protein
MSLETPDIPGNWNPKTIDDVLRDINRYLPPVKELFSEAAVSDTKYVAMYTNYKKAFDIINQTYPPIELPANTLIFHSNQYFSTDQLIYEPMGTQMKIQDIRRYANKGERKNGLNFPMLEKASRLYCNFTPAGNQKVIGNLNVSESIYKSTEPLIFFQLPAILGSNGYVYHIKDLLKLTSTVLFREYIKDKNNNPEKKKYCGFILSTTIDRAPYLDRNTLYFKHDETYIYPEILLMDGFSKFIKVGQYDLYMDKTLDSFGTDEYEALSRLSDLPRKDLDIERIPLETQITQIIETYGVKFENVNYGPYFLPIYTATKHDTFYESFYSHDGL